MRIQGQSLFKYFLLSLFFIVQPISYLKTIGVPINFTMTVALLWSVFYLCDIKIFNINRLIVKDLFVLSLALFLLIAIFRNISYLVTCDYDYLLKTLATVFLCPFSYCIARNLNYLNNSRVISQVASASILACLFFSFLRIVFPEFITDDEIIYGSQYQFAGDTLAVLILILYSTSEVRQIHNTLIFGFLAIIFTGSRATFLCFGASMLFTKIGLKFMLTFMALAIFYIAYYNFDAESIMKSLESMRTLQSLISYLLSGDSAGGLEIRDEYTRNALDVIGRNILFGDLSHYNSPEGSGAYAHNILHIWAAYGIIPFICLSMLLILLVKDFILNFLQNFNNKYIRQIKNNFFYFSTFPLYLFLVFEMFFFRSADNFIFFFGLGAVVKIALEARRSNGNPSAKPPR